MFPGFIGPEVADESPECMFMKIFRIINIMLCFLPANYGYIKRRARCYCENFHFTVIDQPDQVIGGIGIEIYIACPVLADRILSLWVQVRTSIPLSPRFRSQLSRKPLTSFQNSIT